MCVQVQVYCVHGGVWEIESTCGTRVQLTWAICARARDNNPDSKHLFSWWGVFVEIKNRRLCVWKMTEIPFVLYSADEWFNFCGIVEFKSGISRKLHSDDDNEKSWKKHHNLGIWKISISMLNNQSRSRCLWHSMNFQYGIQTLKTTSSERYRNLT